MIDRAFVAVLLLSISGFVFCAVFLVLEKLTYRLTSAKVMEFVNTIALFSFVIPLYLVLSFFDGSENTFRNYETLVFQDGNAYGDAVGFVRSFPLVDYLSIVWIVGAIVSFIYHIWKYICFSVETKAGRFEMNGSIWTEKFEKLKLENDVPDAVITGSCFIPTPSTFGVKTRTVFIPAGMINSFNEQEMDFILHHEFYHVIHRDLLKKFLVMLLSSIHWFNPLFYLLRENLAGWQESANDEEVTKDFDESEKKEYKDLMIKVMRIEKEQQKKNKLLLHFTGNSMRYYKRRMLRVERKYRKTSALGKAVVAAATLISVVSGNVIAKAADVPVNQMFSKNAMVVEAGTIEKVDAIENLPVEEFAFDSHNNMEGFVEIDICNTADTTYEVIYNDAVIASSIGQEPIEPQHLHNIVDITLKEHKKFSDGSCKTTYYEGRECTICGTLWRGDVIEIVIKPKCPH